VKGHPDVAGGGLLASKHMAGDDAKAGQGAPPASSYAGGAPGGSGGVRRQGG
jgi:hypothetical protein